MKKINFFRYCMIMAVALFAGAAMTACGDDDDSQPVPAPSYEDPTVNVIAGEVTSSTITFTVESANATALAYTVVKKGSAAPTPADLLTKGTQLEVLASQTVTVEELSAETTYRIYAAVTNDGGKQVMTEAVEMITEKKQVEPETPVEGDNYIQIDGGDPEKILYAIYDTNGGANYTYNFTSSNLVESFLDLRSIETCLYYISVSPTPPNVEIGAEAVNVANGDYGYVRITENTGTGGGYMSWFSMPGDGSGSSGTVSVKLLDAATEEYEVTLDATIAPYFKAETPRKVKLYYKGIIGNEANEGNNNGNNGNEGNEDMVPLPEGNAFTIGEQTFEVKSAVYEADPDNDMMIKTYLCTAEGITKIAEAEKGEYLLCYLDSSSMEQGAPMMLPSTLGVYFEYHDADGNVVAQWLPTDVDYTGECNASMRPANDVAMNAVITCQTTVEGGLAVNYNGLAYWDDRYFESGGGTEVVQ